MIIQHTDIIKLISLYPSENPRVGGSIPSLGTTRCKASQSTDCEAFFFLRP